MVEQPAFHELESYLARGCRLLFHHLVVASTRAEDGG